jgi:hypothetical protein
MGIDGSYKSASTRAVLNPCLASETARFAAMVDFPTLPLPDAITNMFFTFGSFIFQYLRIHILLMLF